MCNPVSTMISFNFSNSYNFQMSNNQEQQQFPLNDGMIESSASLTGLFEKLCYMYMSICIVCLQHLMGGTHKNSASSQRNDNK